MSTWHIERCDARNQWTRLHNFSHMRETYAHGAWDMLISHYNQRERHRLLKDGVVVSQCGLQQIKPNASHAEPSDEDGQDPR